jgi:hypothetical protein
MTEPERAALDHIRQVVDSVIGVPTPPPGQIPGAQPSILPVPYFSLLVGDANQSANDSGAASGVMLTRAYLDQAVSLSDFYSQAGQPADHCLSFTQILNALGVYGIPVELRSNLKLADLSLVLFSGRPVISPVKQVVLQQAGLTPLTFNGPFYVVVVGMDLKQVFIHDPLRKDTSGKAVGVPWLIFYHAWSRAQGYERAILVPRQQLVRRVRISASVLDVYEKPDGDSSLAGTVTLGELFEVTKQKNGWGRIGENRWVNLTYTADI